MKISCKRRAARRAAELGIALVAPDTSPRLPEDRKLPGEDDSYDFGSGAGFYVDATNYPWSQYYNMYSFVTQELPEAVMVACPEVDVQTRSITGHSMGGHGALTIALKQPAIWRSVSAFSPICNPTKVPWGQKAFEGYLGSVDAGLEHDACELVKKGREATPFSCHKARTTTFWLVIPISSNPRRSGARATAWGRSWICASRRATTTRTSSSSRSSTTTSTSTRRGSSSKQ